MPTRLTVDKLEIAKKKKIQNIGIFYLNYLQNFGNVGSKVASQISKSNTEFSSHLLKIDTTFLEQV